MEQLKPNLISDRDYHSTYASASSGDMKAQTKLGYMYRDGDGGERDGDKAVEWLAKFFISVITLIKERKRSLSSWVSGLR